MNMASGVKYEETYKPGDDHGKFRMAANRVGVVLGAKAFNVREAPQGTRFHYASIETSLIGAVLQTATRESLARYLEPRLWRAIGAEVQQPGSSTAPAWKMPLAACARCLVTICDWASFLPMTVNGPTPANRSFRVNSCSTARTGIASLRRSVHEIRRRTTAFSNYFWLENSRARRFMLLGIHGQAIFVIPRTVW